MAETSKTKDLYEIMSELKEIVLDFLRKDMQPLVQHLEEIIRYPTRSERLFRLETLLNRVKNEAYTTNNCYECLSSSIPSDPPIIQLYLFINQVLEETESLTNIPDLKLFSKLVLFREELRLLEQESSHIALRSLSIDLIQDRVPNAEMTFIKELILVKDSLARISILKKTILTGDMALEGTASVNSSISSRSKLIQENLQEEKKLMDTDEKPKNWNNRSIRPNRLMDCIFIIKGEMSKKESEPYKARIMDIWLDCVKSLEEIAYN